MTDALEFSIVIPALNEAEVIAQVLSELDAALPGRRFEIIVVDDGSDDDTSGRVRAGPAHWRAIRHDVRGGQSAALHSGVLMARSDLIVTLDADGQNPPGEVPKVLATWAAHADDPRFGLVAGQRVGRKDTAAKRLASKAANAIRGAALRDGTRDTGCGLKAIRRDVFLALPYFNHMHRYLPALVNRAGFGIAHVDVGHAPRETGQSKYTNLGRALVGAVDLLGVMWLLRRRKVSTPADMSDPTAQTEAGAPHP